MWWSKLYFDKQDFELLTLVNSIVGKADNMKWSQTFSETNLHPHGIKTLTLSREMRVAYSVARLIDSLEMGNSQNRLNALSSLYDEVLHSAKTNFRRNTARVLIEIMKELIRSHGNIQRQIYLASDFRRAARGTPHVVRELLAHYGLIEMPEDWSQLAFDHHVHDANTKGRKNSTHLVMDAWIRGIRHLTIIYYNYIEEDAAREVLSAAAIVGIKVRIGFEYAVPFRNKYAHFIWSPRGLYSPDDFLEFLNEAPMRHLMELGREASAWQQRYVFMVLDAWNTKHRLSLANKFNLDVSGIPCITPDIFKAFVGVGQASLVHLAECIFIHLLPQIEQAKANFETIEPCADQDMHQKQATYCEALNSITSACIYNDYIAPINNPELPSPYVPSTEPNTPELLRLKPIALLDWLSSIYNNNLITLNIANLDAEDVLEILWQCQGLVTHLELFNLRVWNDDKIENINEIVELQFAINEASVPRLKHVVLTKLKNRLQQDQEGQEISVEQAERCAVLQDILGNIQLFKNFYTSKPLWVHMGSDATGRPESDIGMGLVFNDTLPKNAQKALEKQKENTAVPFYMTMYYNMRLTPNDFIPQQSLLTRLIRLIPGHYHYGYIKEQEWSPRSSSARIAKPGNIAALGNVKKETHKRHHSTSTPDAMPAPKYLNSRLANILKVLIGFIPACIAFQYTQTWWFLAWFGPLIWFGITGVRNIVQAVVAGGGLHRSTLLRWGDHVSWSRLCDSLMYTGFSVPLLELGVRIILLQNTLGYTVSNHTVMVYSIMAAVNGLYIAWHNIIRGLPKAAIIGNIFRSALAIPMAILFSGIIYEILFLTQVADPSNFIQMGSAIISKMASDTVAALIEGYADHKNNVRMRRWDYKTKFQQMFNCYVQIELLFPEDDILNLMVKPKRFMKKVGERNPALRRTLMVNALDFMYFWLYRPRSQEVCKKILARMSKEERNIFGYFQLVLMQERDISRLFVDGMLGRQFGKPLAFYLAMHRTYLKEILPLCSLESKQYVKDNVA